MPQEGANTARFCSLCVKHDYSMKITEYAKKYAAEHNVSEQEALKKGMV